MSEINLGTRVRVTSRVYPSIDEVGTLLATNLLAPRDGSYGTHTILREDGTRYRTEGVISHAPKS